MFFIYKPKIFERAHDLRSVSYPEGKVTLNKVFLTEHKTEEMHKIYVYINPSSSKLFIKSRLVDVDLKESRISADILVAADLKIESEKINGISGWASIKNLKINKSRLLNILARFEYAEKKLKVISLKFGDSYILKGTIDLAAPNLIDLNLKIVRANIRDLAIIARVKDPDAIFGIMEGEFFIKGPLGDLISKGTLVGRNGRIGPVTYDSANINFEGFGPILRIVDSRVRQGQGSMAIEGLIDLRNIGKKNLYDSIKISAGESAYLWNGWGIAKSGSRRLGVERDISEEFKVSFKTFVLEGPLPDYGDKEDEVHLEYRIGNESIKMRFKEDEEFFGLEKTLKF